MSKGKRDIYVSDFKLKAAIEATSGDKMLTQPASEYNCLSVPCCSSVIVQVRHWKRWLRDKIFAQHAKLIRHHLFIWKIWDGLRDYYKLDNKMFQNLIYKYLGDWLNRKK